MSRSPRPATRQGALVWLAWSFLPLAALAPIVQAALLAWVMQPESPLFIDWHAYALGTQRLLSGESLYLPEQLAGPYRLPEVTPAGYIYPPPSALLFAPFAFGQLGLVAWLFFNLATFMSGLAAAIWHELGSVRPGPLGFALLGLGAFWILPDGTFFGPFADGVVNANVNVALAGVLAWCWAAGGRRRWIPYVAGLAGTFKIFPGALALWAARRYGVRPVLLTAGIGVVAAALTLPLVGVEEWRSFVIALTNAEPTCDRGRLSIACALLPHVGTDIAVWAGIAAGAGLALSTLAVRREFLAFVLLTAAMVAPIADGHQHYLLFAYVLLVIGMCRLTRRASRSAVDDISRA